MFTKDLLEVLREIAILIRRNFAYINIYKLSPLHIKVDCFSTNTIQAYEHNYLMELLSDIFFVFKNVDLLSAYQKYAIVHMAIYCYFFV